LRVAYASGELTPVDVVEAVYDRIAARGDDHVWICTVPRVDAVAAAAALDPADRATHPLWGIPFAVKDNIDVAGMDTTAACPDFARTSDASATVVRRLVDAGALLIGKTNLDQFATGLNGTRSPYGIPASPFDDAYISGGSSSGSAVAVSAGLVSFALGTDTAGSGRVPAALTNVVGMKPSIGLVSTTGVLPACRSLDCVTVFSLTVADGSGVLAVIAGPDAEDPWSRELPPPPAQPSPADLAGVRFGVPSHIDGWGTLGEQEAWQLVCDELVAAGATLVPVEMSDFLDAGSQLYGGAWLAERLEGLQPFITTHRSSVHPVLLDILAPAAHMLGTEVFDSLGRMREWRRTTSAILTTFDALLTPTVTATFTIADVLASPIELNSRLGRWTTFTNLLDLCAVAIPAGLGDRGMPFGITVQAAAGQDARVAALALGVENLLDVTPGAAPAAREAGFELAVVGAHLAGQPLHGELLRHRATLVERTTTSESYRLFALHGTTPAKPGLQRVRTGGAAIEVEVYALPTQCVGGFLDGVTAPLAIGQLDLADGRTVHGFVCEPFAFDAAEDITEYGGWRAYLDAAADQRGSWQSPAPQAS